jgi:hypothetical protein
MMDGSYRLEIGAIGAFNLSTLPTHVREFRRHSSVNQTLPAVSFSLHTEKNIVNNNKYAFLSSFSCAHSFLVS